MLQLRVKGSKVKAITIRKAHTEMTYNSSTVSHRKIKFKENVHIARKNNDAILSLGLGTKFTVPN